MKALRRCLLGCLSFAFSVSLILAPRAIHGQGITTGNITGNVVDAQGAVVSGATVSAKDVARGAVITTTSRANGTFSFPDVPTGTYNIHVTAGGFQPLDLTGVLVTVGNTANLNALKLSVGTAVTSVMVHDANQVQLNTVNAQVSTVFSPVELEQLPLANSFDTVALLSPGTARTLQNSFSNSNGPGFLEQRTARPCQQF